MIKRVTIGLTREKIGQAVETVDVVHRLLSEHWMSNGRKCKRVNIRGCNLSTAVERRARWMRPHWIDVGRNLEAVGLVGRNLEAVGLVGRNLQAVGLLGRNFEAVGLLGRNKKEAVVLVGQNLEATGLLGRNLEAVGLVGRNLEAMGL